MLTPQQAAFVESQRAARLATVGSGGVPHIVPVCFAIAGASLYVGLDAKPKSVAALRLKRVRNIAADPNVSLLVDRYDEDWTKLAWVRLDGTAEVLLDGPEHDEALRLLRERYEQYASLLPDEAPVIAVRVRRAASWGAA